MALGGAVLLSTAAGSSANAGVIIFEDDFNRNNSGIINTVAGMEGWTEEPGGTSTDVSIFNMQLRLRDDIVDSGARASQLALSTLGFENITISYTFDRLNAEMADMLLVEYSTGGAFTTANMHALSGGGSVVNLSLAADNAAVFQFRFRTVVGTNFSGDNPDLDGALIDNVVVMGDRIVMPEPGTLALFGLGLAGLVVARRKKA